jgi:hypothetical protein
MSAPRTPAQLARHRRVLAGIRLAAPLLDVVLGAGDRVSRVLGRGRPQPEPPRRPRAATPGPAAPPALPPGRPDGR